MEHLLLLHGAIGGSDQLQPLAEALQHKYNVHTINFSGHGGSAIPDEPFSIPMFAAQILDWLQENDIPEINLFGYSMGGYVSLYLAKFHPQKIKKAITLATKFYWDEAIAAKEEKLLDADIILQKIPAFAQQLIHRHAPQDWKMVLEKTKELLQGLGKNNTLQLTDYANITTPVLLLLGDQDKMITIEETVAVFELLPHAQMGMLPGTPHPIEHVHVNTLVFFINNFLEK